MKMMEILLTGDSERQQRWQGEWYDEEEIKDMLSSMLKEGTCLQCRYEDHIMILTDRTRAVFDSSGNLLELYNLKTDPEKNVAGTKEGTELEFEMIVLLSKFNME